MQKPKTSICLLAACALASPGCAERKADSGVTNDYQAPVAQIAPPANLRSICYEESDLSAFRVRMVQQVLVVGVLQCKGANGRIHLDDEYAAFVQKFNPELAANAAEMKSLVARKRANLDVVVTEIANRTAQRPTSDPAFCSRHERALAWALQPHVTSLRDVPSPYDFGPEMRVFPCPQK